MLYRSFVCLFLASAALALVVGCQTAATFPTPAADWQSYSGQMQYVAPTGKSVIGEGVVRRSKQGDFQLAFSSGPGFPLLRLWQSGSRVRAEGVFARGSWQGAPEHAPKPLRGWCKLPAVFSALPKTGTFSGAGWKAQSTAGQLIVTVSETGERFAFHFGP